MSGVEEAGRRHSHHPVGGTRPVGTTTPLSPTTDTASTGAATTQNQVAVPVIDTTDTNQTQTLGTSTVDPSKVAFGGHHAGDLTTDQIVAAAQERLPGVDPKLVDSTVRLVAQKVSPQTLEYLLNSVSLAKQETVSALMKAISANPQLLDYLANMPAGEPEKLRAQLEALPKALEMMASMPMVGPMLAPVVENVRQLTQDFIPLAIDVGQQQRAGNNLEKLAPHFDTMVKDLDAIKTKENEAEIAQCKNLIAEAREVAAQAKANPNRYTLNRLDQVMDQIYEEIDYLETPENNRQIDKLKATIDDVQFSFIAPAAAAIGQRSQTVSASSQKLIAYQQAQQKVHQAMDASDPKQRAQLLQSLEVREVTENGKTVFVDKNSRKYASLDELHDALGETFSATVNESVTHVAEQVAKAKEGLAQFAATAKDIEQNQSKRMELLDKLQSAASDKDRQDVTKQLAQLRPPVLVQFDNATKKMSFVLQGKDGEPAIKSDDISKFKEALTIRTNTALTQIQLKTNAHSRTLADLEEQASYVKGYDNIGNKLRQLENAVENGRVDDYKAIVADLKKINKDAGLELNLDHLDDFNGQNKEQALHTIHETGKLVSQKLALSDVRLHKKVEDAIEDIDRISANSRGIGSIEQGLHSRARYLRDLRDDGHLKSALDAISQGREPSDRNIEALKDKDVEYQKGPPPKFILQLYDPTTGNLKPVEIKSSDEFKAVLQKYDVDVITNANEARLNITRIDHAIEVVDNLLKNPDLSPEERTRLTEKRQHLLDRRAQMQAVIDSKDEKRQVVFDAMVDILGMTKEQAGQAMAEDEQEAARIFFKDHGFYLDAKMAADASAVSASDAIAAEDAGSSSSQPSGSGGLDQPTVVTFNTPNAAAAAEQQGEAKSFFSRLFNQVINSVIGKDADQITESEQQHNKQAQQYRQEHQVTQAAMEKKQKEKEIEQEELSRIADLEADKRLKDAGLREKSLVEKAADDARNQSPR